MRVLTKALGALLALLILATAAFFLFAPAYVESQRNAVIPHAPYPVSTEARALHDSLIVGDWHADPLLWKRDLAERGNRGQVDIPRLIEGGVAVQVFTAVTKSPAGQNYEENSAEAFDNITLLAVGQLWPMRTWTSIYERAIYQAEKLHRFERQLAGQLRIIKSRADLDAVLTARAEGGDIVGGILGVEGLHPLEGDFAKLDGLYDAGHRLFGLHHFFDNELGGSLHGTGDAGLTEFGLQVVAELARRPVIIDLAHSSPQVVREVLEMTDVPLVLSHSGLHSHCEVTRNLPDDLMRQIAETGGVIGMGYWADVVCGPITPDGIAEMIAAAIAVVGEDHVSLGSDFDGSVETAFDTSELPALTHALLAQGLSEAQIAKVMGGNMIRVLRARLD
ncbi:dipeptidase [Lutimaribacter sp. EGI FJ00015]|uniref:Dipeptidase n=1 Tax=Lutimaribacter degradans TaxID=2945989 RepID=A0ACC5ZT90_9RHOB|nr:dipeptidase [Lutimaribacter sp. EGI FJ00013]MCM2561400.1 dipeptidase [Lutimaribacter sp. EGI FJ00013]MCO0612890.1 dipeptidase [Lutimaribacter sp. EGI FJ00015]MCO0635548.1 dipeptidase [Lutimaribacter sp. EGI FJ00014]